MKKAISLLLTLVMMLSLVPAAFAASDEATQAANHLHDLGLFEGVGTRDDGTINYDLDRTMTRAEAITMLVRLLGKENEAKATKWQTPFTDVAEWAQPYVGYAYAHSLTSGVSPRMFGSSTDITATQYLTFVLRALGYSSDSDFQWDKAWALTDKLGITNGQYNANTVFERSNAVIVSNKALSAEIKNTGNTLLASLQPASGDTTATPGTTSPAPGNITPASDSTTPTTTNYSIVGVWSHSVGTFDESEYVFDDNGNFTCALFSTIFGYDNRSACVRKGTYTIHDSIIELSYDQESSSRQVQANFVNYSSLSNQTYQMEYELISPNTLKIGAFPLSSPDKFTRISQPSIILKASNEIAAAKADKEYSESHLNANLVTAKLDVLRVGASNNSYAEFTITNHTEHAISLYCLVTVNGYGCFVKGDAKDMTIEANKEYKILVYNGLFYPNGRSTIKDNMYLDNNSKAKFVITYNGVKYQGECDTSGNTTLVEVKN